MDLFCWKGGGGGICLRIFSGTFLTDRNAVYNTKMKVVKTYGLECMMVLNTLMIHHAKGIFI